MSVLTTVQIGEVADVIRGVTYQKQNASFDPGPGLVPLIRATNIDESLDFFDLTFVPRTDVNDEQLLRQGDIVLAASSGSRNVVGKAAPLRMDWFGTFGAFCFTIRPRAGFVEPLYLSYYLQTSTYRHEASRLAAGVNINNLRREHIEGIELPLLPIKEQRRVVGAVESYLSRLDDAVASLERVQRNLKRYRAAVLQAAVEGRLVPTEAELARAEGRSFEPASELLARILTERRRRWEESELAKLRAKGKEPKNDSWKSKYVEPAGPDSALPVLPNGWCWTTVESTAWDGGYGTSEKCAEEAGGPPVLRIPNVQRGAIVLDDLKFAIRAEELSADLALRQGDFLFIRTNGSRDLIGRGAVVDRALEPDHFFASYLIRLRLVNIEDTAHWFGLAWQSSWIRSLVLRDAASSAGQYNVSLSAAMRYTLPLPPAAEQKRILAEVGRLMSVADEIEREAQRSLTRCHRLRQSILKWAFEGKLVDQDPNDEPASVLLERIRAERAAGPEPRRRSRGSGRPRT